jgi:hypothetical protein
MGASGEGVSVPEDLGNRNVRPVPAASAALFLLSHTSKDLRNSTAQSNNTFVRRQLVDIISNIAANMAGHRNNVILADFQGLLIPNTTVVGCNPDGTGCGYTFRWDTIDKFVQTSIDAGAMEYLILHHCWAMAPT